MQHAVLNYHVNFVKIKLQHQLNQPKDEISILFFHIFEDNSEGIKHVMYSKDLEIPNSTTKILWSAFLI